MHGAQTISLLDGRPGRRPVPAWRARRAGGLPCQADPGDCVGARRRDARQLSFGRGHDEDGWADGARHAGPELYVALRRAR